MQSAPVFRSISFFSGKIQYFRSITASLVFFVSLGCTQTDPGTKPQAQSSAESAKHTTSEKTVVHIPVGKLQAGSSAEEAGRNPAWETQPQELKLGPFRIDSRLHRSKDGTLYLSESIEKAAEVCAQKSKGGQQGRLCTEAEWERACKGEGQSTYPDGDEPCSQECLSEFGISEMTEQREWTSSLFRSSSSAAGQKIIRGAAPNSPLATHRCSARQPATEKLKAAVRCCYGAKNAAFLKEETLGTAYTLTDLPLEELQSLLESDDRTRELAKDLSYFNERGVETVFARGPGKTKGFSLTHRSLIWQPATGVKYLVVAAKSGDKTSFVVAYHEQENERTLAGSFMMKNESGPIALAFAESIRPRMHFSSCWGCPGETGKLLFRPPNELVLLQP